MGKSVRRWISFVAIFSVLLHAAFAARHNQSVIDATFANQFSAYLSVVCGDIVVDRADTPDLPAPNKTAYKCPICMGAAPAVAALTDSVAPLLDTPLPTGPRLTSSPDRIAPSTIMALPPSRAPPVAA